MHVKIAPGYAVAGCRKTAGTEPHSGALVLPKQLTDPARFFLEPSIPTHRQYEALRAYFVEGLSSTEAAARYGYTPGSFRVLCHQFRHNPDPKFFAPVAKGPQTSPKSDPLREQIIRLRKQNFSIYDISQTLRDAGTDLSPAAISLILKQEALHACRVAAMMRELVQTWREPRPPTVPDSLSPRVVCAPNSAASFCFFPTWPAFPST
jgi:hypothetical protein